MALRTIEEIQDALDLIVGTEEGADALDFTDDELAQIAALETEMTAAQDRREKTVAARKRIADGKSVGPALITKEKGQKDSLEAAFTAYLRTGRANSDIEELRNAQSEGTASEGGYLVPEGFRQKLVDRMKAFGGLANEVEEVTTETGNNLPWPTLDDTSNVGEVVDEGGTFSGGADLVFGEASLGAWSYMAGGAGGNPLRLSRELVQDAAFNIDDIVSSKLGMRLARIQAQHIVRGTGVKQPLGITTGLTPVATAGNAITYADLLKFVHSVDPAYRQGGNCRWAFNDATLQTIQGILDGSNRPILKGFGEGIGTDPGGATLLGYPVTIDQSFLSFTNNSTQIAGVFGDLEEGYVIRRVKAVELLVNPWSRLANRQIEYSAWSRMDATQQNTNAYSALTGHS